jgi:hypothetical protein
MENTKSNSVSSVCLNAITPSNNKLKKVYKVYSLKLLSGVGGPN